MQFYELRGLIQKSDASEWHRVDEGPTYRYRFAAYYESGGENYRLEQDSHGDAAVYIPDIDLTIAWGMDEEFTHISDFGPMDKTLKWAEAFPDSTWKISRADIFWRGSLVDRADYIAVDGFRAYLPIGGGHDGLAITDFDYDMARLIDGFVGHSEFKSYYDRVPYRPKF
jgi:hypothetical protein